MKKHKNFSNDNKALLSLLTYDGTSEIAQIPDVNWGSVIRSARAHCVLLTASKQIVERKNVIPHKNYAGFIYAMGKVLAANDKVYVGQKELLSVLSGKVKCLIIKGFSTAIYYDEPKTRTMGDIDVLVKKSDLENTEKLLEENGYVRQKGDDIYDVLFQKDGLLVEVHFSVAGIPGGKYGEIIKAFMADIFETAVNRECLGQRFLSPDDAHNAIIMLLHLQHHFFYGSAGLKQIVDWSMFTAKTLNAPFWEEQVLPLIKSTGLFVFTAALTKACGKYLKSPVPKWAEEYSEDGYEIIDSIIKSGEVSLSGKNYKNADVLTDKGQNDEYRKRSRISLALSYIHRATILSFPIVKKVFILYPFMYCYKAVGCFFKAAFLKRKDFNEMNEFAKKNKKLQEKFRIFENNKW
ncbi:MAG: nucleotidyltransferase family protein [Clostridia bacterium]|nr:nucleotidyltransferase family protein [Clostridia bacterium]